jgi:catechol 2,3-dioxygenase-like lactoylglutathione lyase family enzyme
MSIIKIVDVEYVRFRAPDLAVMEGFLEDFGLTKVEGDGKRLFMRGRDSAPFLHATELGEPGFAAVGFKAENRGALERLAREEGAKVEALDTPGGGFVVALKDPDGFRVEVVAEQKPAQQFKFEDREPWNIATRRDRLRRTKRVGAGSSSVLRLGHCVLAVSNFRNSERWYKDRFGFITSDEIAVSPEMSLGAFLRCDRGEQPTDHHTLFLLQSPKGVGFNHAAFEVRDFDDLMRGHQHLAAHGRTPEWGVGRHILGSQVFDYWRDPWGHTLEHWTDGDLFTAADGSNVVPLPDLLGVQWGPNAPPTMG